MGSEEDKIVRVPGESSIKVSSEEEYYRKKYLPDVKKLTDEKLVCTVCSISLAQNIHKGKDLYIHRALQVLVCEACYNFYGDGCFSADEDGDDKYCRWCGQGGTLFLCSKCNCGFCQKCTKQNLKASVLAELENDDWKCYICNPRPLFGCRTICWGAQQLNQMGKEKEAERLQKIKERLQKLESKRKEEKERERKSRKVSSEDDTLKKKRKRSSDEDSSSPEVISAPKKRNIESRGKKGSRNVNGSIGRRRKDSSSDSESDDNKKVSRHSRRSSKKDKIVEPSSEDDTDSKRKKEKLKKKKKEDSDESSDSGKKKTKTRSRNKKDTSDESSSEDEKSKNKSKPTKKRYNSSDSSSEGKKKKKSKKKKHDTSSEEYSGEIKKRHRKIVKKKSASSSDSEDDKPSKSSKKGKTENEDVNANSTEDILVKKRIKLAILWLQTIINDISELGSLISIRATKFSKKKINAENIKTYEDVLNCVSKIKHLINGVHSNYDHIEKTLDSHLKPWKILTGLEDADNEKNADAESSLPIDGDISKANESPLKPLENTSQDIKMNGMEESKQASDGYLNNWSDDSDDQNETRDLISKVNKSLEKSQIEEQQLETNNKSSEDNNCESKKIDCENNCKEESSVESDVKKSKAKSKMSSSEPEKPKTDSKLETPKKTPTNNKEDSSISEEKASESKKEQEANSENEPSSPDKSTPVNKSSKEDQDSARSENEECNKTDSEGDKEIIHPQSDLRATDRQDSTEEVFQTESSTLGLGAKRQSKMNLKQSLDLELDDSDRKKELIPKIVIKKLKIEGSNDNEHEIDNSIQIEEKKQARKTTSKEERSVQKSMTKGKTKKTSNTTQINDKKSNCLSSSDEDDEKTVSKTKIKQGKREESNDDKIDDSKSQRRKLKSIASRKDKLQDCSSDDNAGTKSKKIKLKKSKESKENDENEDEEKKSTSYCEENDKMQTDEKNEMNGNPDVEDFSLELAENSANSEDAKMVQERESECENKQEKTDLSDTNKSCTLKDKEDKVNLKEERIKFVGLDSSSEEEVKPITKKKPTPKKKTVNNQKKTRHVLALSSEDEAEPTNISSEEDNDLKEEKDEDFAVVLSSDNNSSDSEILPKNKRKKKASSDSDDASISGEDSIKKKKRKRVKCADSSDESGESGDDKKEGESPSKGGRKNIKKIKKKGDLEQTTIEAAEEERERRRRIEERQKLFNQVFEVKESTKLEKLVLDFDPETKSELISVNTDLVTKMKPHQAKGVKFMWDSCFESVKQIKKTKGSGCILAHCMGLGKTFQVVSLVHTLLTHEQYTKGGSLPRPGDEKSFCKLLPDYVVF